MVHFQQELAITHSFYCFNSENESEDISVCSDEERDIMAEIRAEITQKVREEMKSELEVYQQAKSNLNKDKDKTEDDDLTG